MLIKEYRVLMPLSVEEYRLAQLYMIQKKSRLESSGAGSGVEIIKNEPYENGPGGSGQYTYKIYHIGNRIPQWIRNVLPSNALEAHEEAWNAYPYTRTRYSCPLISHFRVEVDTKYLDDAGTSGNVFDLPTDELKGRTIDVLDFVRDAISSHDYSPEEDPKLYKSEKTERGPLSEKWVEEHQRDGRPVMCAYKLCKVEFRYWGLQTRGERWIHELALRGTMLRAHRQAWAWQDEWVGLDMEDIRRLESETQKYLCTLMTAPDSTQSSSNSGRTKQQEVVVANGLVGHGKMLSVDERDEEEDEEEEEEVEEAEEAGQEDNRSLQSDVFFDCSDKLLSPQRHTLVRWSSELLVDAGEDGGDSSPHIKTARALLVLVFHGDLFPKTAADSKITDTNTFRSTLEALICSHYSQLRGQVHVHCVTCGSELSPTAQLLNGICSSLDTFHPSIVPLLSADADAFEKAVQNSIENANRTLQGFLASEAGKSFGPDDDIFVVGDFIGGLLMYEALTRTAARQQREGSASAGIRERSPTTVSHTPASTQSSPYLKTGGREEACSTRSLQCVGQYFNFDDNRLNGGDHYDPSPSPVRDFVKQRSAPPVACRQMSNMSESALCTRQKRSCSLLGAGNALSFRPSAAFLLGCPLALVLMQRKLTEAEQHLCLACDQLFNLYYALDLCATRLEPVLNPSLSVLPAMKVPRYQRYPLGDGHDIHFDGSALDTPLIWGTRRVDHELYCPPEMSSLPATALPSILHASYWESKDLSSFILRQFLRSDENSQSALVTLNSAGEQPPFDFQVPLTVWNRRRTRFKVANLAANHQANDLIVVEGAEQVIHARFCYGPMDLVVLSHENVLVYVLPSGGEWFLRGVETTDKHGRLTINMGKALPIGMHNVRLIVQGDQTYLSVNIAVVPPGTPVVVFSIDGSLTASVSVTGRDPRLRPGAVDVVRFWQQQGYLIIYLTARPDMQQRLVSTWLATHNFPHGLLFFTPSLSTDPLRQKTQYMKHLSDTGICIQAAYGSAKDIPVYSNAGLGPERIFKVGGHKRRGGCVSLDDGYCAHLHDLHTGKVALAQPVYNKCSAIPESPLSSRKADSSSGGGSGPLQQHRSLEHQVSGAASPWRSPLPRQQRIQRTLSFGPRSGRYCAKKFSQVSTGSTNY